MIEKQLKYFKEHQKELMKKFSGRFLIISEDLEIIVFDTLPEAYTFGVEKYGLGNFLLQNCSPNHVGKIQVISPTVVFA